MHAYGRSGATSRRHRQAGVAALDGNFDEYRSRAGENFEPGATSCQDDRRDAGTAQVYCRSESGHHDANPATDASEIFSYTICVEVGRDRTHHTSAGLENCIKKPLDKPGALKNQVQHFSERMLHGKKLQSVEY